MQNRDSLQFRLMTYNLGGAREDLGSTLSDVAKVIKEISPDILIIQEAVEFQNAEGVWHSALDRIAQAGEFGKHVHFAPVLSLREHMHVQKASFVYSLFNDWLDFRQGNAILCRWEFGRLGDPSKPGLPRNIPLYMTPVYQGNRDTEPRYAVLARVNRAPIFPFVVGVHFTTLVAEREKEGGPRPLPDRAEEAQALRLKQAKRLLDLLREYALEPGEVVFLMGDFNAIASESCISSVLEGEGRFKRLTPSQAKMATHPKVTEPIDHIFVHPSSRLIDYQCWIVDSPTARRASDHLPVVAEVRVQ